LDLEYRPLPHSLERPTGKAPADAYTTELDEQDDILAAIEDVAALFRRDKDRLTIVLYLRHFIYDVKRSKLRADSGLNPQDLHYRIGVRGVKLMEKLRKRLDPKFQVGTGKSRRDALIDNQIRLASDALDRAMAEAAIAEDADEEDDRLPARRVG
jgi:ribosome recycling factor